MGKFKEQLIIAAERLYPRNAEAQNQFFQWALEGRVRITPKCIVIKIPVPVKANKSSSPDDNKSYSQPPSNKPCPECKGRRNRWLDCQDCEDKGKTCPLIICCDCGATVEDVSVRRKRK